MRGGAVSELPMATAGETQPSKPGVLQWGDSEGQGDQVSGKWVRGGETPLQETCCLVWGPSSSGAQSGARQKVGGRVGRPL